MIFKKRNDYFLWREVLNFIKELRKNNHLQKNVEIEKSGNEKELNIKLKFVDRLR
jgi:hypothetical protein